MLRLCQCRYSVRGSDLWGGCRWYPVDGENTCFYIFMEQWIFCIVINLSCQVPNRSSSGPPACRRSTTCRSWSPKCVWHGRSGRFWRFSSSSHADRGPVGKSGGAGSGSQYTEHNFLYTLYWYLKPAPPVSERGDCPNVSVWVWGVRHRHWRAGNMEAVFLFAACLAKNIWCAA